MFHVSDSGTWKFYFQVPLQSHLPFGTPGGSGRRTGRPAQSGAEDRPGRRDNAGSNRWGASRWSQGSSTSAPGVELCPAANGQALWAPQEHPFDSWKDPEHGGNSFLLSWWAPLPVCGFWVIVFHKSFTELKEYFTIQQNTHMLCEKTWYPYLPVHMKHFDICFLEWIISSLPSPTRAIPLSLTPPKGPYCRSSPHQGLCRWLINFSLFSFQNLTFNCLPTSPLRCFSDTFSSPRGAGITPGSPVPTWSALRALRVVTKTCLPSVPIVPMNVSFISVEFTTTPIGWAGCRILRLLQILIWHLLFFLLSSILKIEKDKELFMVNTEIRSLIE